MIFANDIALPYKEIINLKNLPQSFNDKDAIKQLSSQLNFAGFALANNHIFDTGSFEEIVSFLVKLNVRHC